MKVEPFRTEYSGAWDDLCRVAPMATFLQTRRFLSYHGDRFRDLSSILEDDNGRLVGVFPAAVDPGDSTSVSSHPGITYGGVIHAGRLRGARLVQALQLLMEHYFEHGYLKICYKAVPYIYHRYPTSDDLYALFRVGARRYRCDLSSTIDLTHRVPPSERRRRGVRKAEKCGVRVVAGFEQVSGFWNLLQETLGRKHGVAPVHTVDEIRQIHELFPDCVQLVVGMTDDRIVAGTVLFRTPTVVHAQYIAASELGEEICALDAVLEACIQAALGEGARYFDFGISNERAGHYLNDGLYTFKSEFGGGGIIHEFYEIPFAKGEMAHVA